MKLKRSCNAPGRCNCCLEGHATFLQRFRALQLLPPGPRNAPTTLAGAATAASSATQVSSNAPGRCNWCLQGHAPLLQCSRALQILLPEPRSAPATLADAATAAFGPLLSSCNALGYCNCCVLATASHCNAPVPLLDAATAASWPLRRSRVRPRSDQECSARPRTDQKCCS